MTETAQRSYEKSCRSCESALPVLSISEFCSRCMPREQPSGAVITGLSIDAVCDCGDRREVDLPTGQIQIHETTVELNLSWFCPACERLNKRRPLLLGDEIRLDADTPCLVLCNGGLEVVTVDFAGAER